MTYSPLAIKRRQILADLYEACEPVESVPVHLEDPQSEQIGHVDEGLGHYADAFLFHLPEDICKKLSTGHYQYSFDYDYADPESTGRNRKIKLNFIVLTGRKTLNPVSRQAKKAAAELASESAELQE